MKSRERAKRVLEDMREGSIVSSPLRSEVIIANAICEARAYGAALVLHVIREVAGFDDAVVRKLASVVTDVLQRDEEISSEPKPPKLPDA